MKSKKRTLHAITVHLFAALFCLTSCSVNQRNSVDHIDVDRNLSNESLLTKANEYFEERNFEEAKKYYDLLIDQRGVSDGEVLYKRGYSNALLLNLAESTSDYMNAANLGYRPSDSYFNAGINQKLNYNDSLAIIFFEMALKIDPSDSAAIVERQKALDRIEKFNQILKN